MHVKLVRLLACVLLACGTALGASDPNLLGWWKLSDGQGTTVVDSSGHEYNGTITNPNGGLGGSVWVSDFNRGTVLGFSGDDSAGAYVAAGVTAPMTATNSFTWAFWSKQAAGQAHNNDVILGNRYGATTWIKFTPNFFEFGSNATGYAIDYPNFPADLWVHNGVVKEGQTFTYYRDGEVAGTQVISRTCEALPLYMGGDPQGERWQGCLSDVRVYDRALTDKQVKAVMMGIGPNAGLAVDPSPADKKATDVPRDAVLTWKPGQYAKTHDVYFGTAFDDVNNASRTDPLAGSLASQGQDANSFDPTGLMAYGQTYYWRVDEVNAAPDSTIYKGDVWRFTVEPYGYPVKPVKTTASSSSSSIMGPEKTIDGSGLESQDRHSTSASHMWTSKKGTTPIWIQYEFDKVCKLYQMWVWNSNQAVEPDIGMGAKDVVVETSTDGNSWTAMADVPEFSQATGEADYTYNTVVDFRGAQAKYVRLTIKTNWADGTKQAGLSEVRFFYVPVKAFAAVPSSGASGVAITSGLNWRPGREAARHEVYLSTDANAVIAGTAPSSTVTTHSLALAGAGVEYGKTYYWKVNEVNDEETPKSWEGDLWSFATPEYGVVDDFESYNDRCGRVFFAWVDGFGYSASADCGLAASSGNGTGSTVGHTDAPFAERTIVHKGAQSMPLAYDNTTGKGYSEATRTFDVAQDWTQGGAKTLVLFVRGGLDNGAGQLYVTINGTKVTYTGGDTVLTSAVWKQWNIDLASVGTDLKAVKALAVGVSGSGKGTIYVDDVLLYRVAPAVTQPSDPATNGLVAWYRMEGDVKDSSGKGNNGTAQGNPIYVDGPAGYGKALQFEGVDDHVELPIGNLISTMTSCTVTTWVNLNTSNTGSWERIFDFGTSSTAGYMFLSPRQSTNGAMRFAITTGTNSGESGLNSPANLPAGWHQVAAIIDGTAKTLQLCLDGEVVASGTTAVLPKDLGKTTQNWLGRSQWSADAYFAGILDDFRIYTRALSAGEVRYLAGDR